MDEFTKLYEAIRDGDAEAATAISREALANGSDPLDLVNGYMIPAMDEVGRRFDCEQYFLPELLRSARAMKGALDLVRPLLAQRGTQPTARVVIGTVKGDLHDIGKNLVASMLEGGGFEVLDLGVDVPPEKFIDAVITHNAQIVALSALLTVTMPAMKKTIEALRQAGVRDRVKVIVGGAPITREYAERIGADGYSGSATGAVALAREAVSRG